MSDNEAFDLTGLETAVSRYPSLAIPKLCSNCAYSEMEGKDRVCRFDPPKMSFIPIPIQTQMPGPRGPMMVNGIEVKNVSGFPVVKDDQWCGKWEKRSHSD